jgi:ribonuclease HII
VACIAAASILAKVTRDAIMTDLHVDWPQYGFDRHKGYVTASHSAALAEHGPCPHHRRRYVNVRRALGEAVEALPGLQDFDLVGENGLVEYVEVGCGEPESAGEIA